MTYKVLFSKETQKDAKKIKKLNLSNKCKSLIELLYVNPFAVIPPYEKLVGELT